MKKLFKLSLVLVICFMMTFFLVGCNKNKKEENLSRVTVDINPSVELIVDEDGKVVSVTALNDDGNIIIVGEAIVGKTVEEAVSLIVNVATDTGYLVKGEISASENEIKVSVSGDEKAREELYNSIKKEVEKVISSEQIKAVVAQKEALDRAALEALVMELDSTLTAEQVKEMTEQQLLAVVNRVRIEKAELLSVELAKAYDMAKAYEVKIVEREETKKVINALDANYQTFKANYGELVDAFSQSIVKMEESYFESFVAPTSEYQKCYAKLLEAQAELVKQKELVAGLEEGLEKETAKLVLSMKEKAYSQSVLAMETIYKTVNTIFEAVLNELKAIEAQLISYETALPTEIKTQLNSKASEIEAACNSAKADFFTKFETEHQAEIEYYKNLMQAQKDKLLSENTPVE